MMPLEPVRDLVYVIPLRNEKIGSIHRPDTHIPRVNQGIVKYIGPACVGRLVKGDHVYFSGYDGDEMVMEGEGTLIVLHEEDIMAVDQGDEPDDWTFTLKDVEAIIDKATVRVLERVEEREYQNTVRIVSQRIKEELDAQFFKELYF